MTFLENEPLSRHTTLRTGGPARFFCRVESLEDLYEALEKARVLQWRFFVLGGGSNVLASDAGFPGLIVRVALKGMSFEPAGKGEWLVEAAAGEEWDGLVASAVGRGLRGLENLSGIPGTVGGAVAGNIGAYGVEVRETLKWVEVLDAQTGGLRRLDGMECGFGYRSSRFKSPEGRREVITRACFLLGEERPLNVSYGELHRWFEQRGEPASTVEQVRVAVIEVRRAKLPDTMEVGTAGSFFKNPVIPRTHYEQLLKRYPELPGYAEPNGYVKIPLGWVLDRICGLKGVRRGRVGTHDQQALVVVNRGGSAGEIEALAAAMAQEVFDRTGIHVAWEVERLGGRPDAD